MMTLPAYCGFFCDRCPVYQAAADGDKSMKEELAQRYTTAGQPLSAEDIRCQGCRAQESQLSVFCQNALSGPAPDKKGCPIAVPVGSTPVTIWKNTSRQTAPAESGWTGIGKGQPNR